VDLNMVVPLETMKQHPMYDEFQCQTDFVSRSCEALYLRPCDLAAMRAEAGMTCDGDKACAAADGYCVDPTCRDDPIFKDEKGFYCDQWVGEDCARAAEDYGYSQANEEQILAKCRHSCLLCTRAASPSECHDECAGQTGNVVCRDRITGVDVNDPNSEDYKDATATLSVLSTVFLTLNLL
jgi:hypothetical protein